MKSPPFLIKRSERVGFIFNKLQFFMKKLSLIAFILMASSVSAQQLTEMWHSTRSKPIFKVQQKPLLTPRDSVQQLTDRIVTPKLLPLITSFDLMIRPEDITSGNVVAPRINGTYSKSLIKKAVKVNYAFNLNIQSPQTTKDTLAMLNRIISSGGVGSFSGKVDAEWYSKDTTSGFTIAVLPTFSWQNSQQLKDGNSGNFAYYSTRISAMAWTGPFILSVQGSYYNLLSGSPKFVSNGMNHKMIWTLFGGLYVGQGFYLQGKFVLGAVNSNKESYEVSFVKTLSFL
jgi:hypothetical protein